MARRRVPVTEGVPKDKAQQVIWMCLQERQSVQAKGSCPKRPGARAACSGLSQH